jgi:uncharacterized SAM-binding protein YcdF (DUF218 family)
MTDALRSAPAEGRLDPARPAPLPTRPKRIRWRLGLVLVLLGVLAVGSTLATLAFRHVGDWLAAPGHSVALAPGSADLIVTLGGDVGGRAQRAIELYQQGVAPRVMLAGPETADPAVLPHILEWRAAMMRAAGLPADAILLGLPARNSWEEATATLAQMERDGWRRVVVVSDPPHLRRLDLAWSAVFAGSGREFVLVPAQAPWWHAMHWWQDERSAAFGINEAIKLAYYAAGRPAARVEPPAAATP